MTDKQIFKKAILKAEKNGFNVSQYLPSFPPKGSIDERKIFTLLYAIKEKILFSHDFAQKFWGEEWKDGDVISTPLSEILAQENIKPWQHHLRQMVLKKEPLKYLEEFIK